MASAIGRPACPDALHLPVHTLMILICVSFPLFSLVFPAQERDSVIPVCSRIAFSILLIVSASLQASIFPIKVFLISA